MDASAAAVVVGPVRGGDDLAKGVALCGVGSGVEVCIDGLVESDQSVSERRAGVEIGRASCRERVF